ncbi:ATP phosphoribosyltransferase regulatory subunit [Piscinibacter sakaiensis]|uniref:ATP phosphoribosyltransferase regulatory subunit n=1 Tax=Piscinibacter sakaiensis TaxID=1547922 RepID=UPI003AAE7A31
MSSAWLLPEHISDVLPAQARHIEELRRGLIDGARRCGYELVIPPLLEHLESLLSGTGHALDLQTFKLADQLSGRTLGVRADTTPQVARIDAHLLNRVGLARLCYCGPVLHTRPAGLSASREPLQFGAEIYGHGGIEAELEIIDLALDGLASAGLDGIALDLGDTRIVRSLLAGIPVDAASLSEVVAALAAKDPAALREASSGFPDEARAGLQQLLGLYGAVDVLQAAEKQLPARAPLQRALADLRQLAEHVARVHPTVQLGVDLADLGGYSYYSGSRFAVYAAGSSDAVLRGGRYDEVGAVFGRNRPAVGFSLDVKLIASLLPTRRGGAAIRAPWSDDPSLRAAVRRLREKGDAVVCILPGHEHEGEEFECDRELVAIDGQWLVRSL